MTIKRRVIKGSSIWPAEDVERFNTQQEVINKAFGAWRGANACPNGRTQRRKGRSAAAIPRLKEPVEKYRAAKKKVPMRPCEKAVSGTKSLAD
jgi:hypothetical protein